MDLHVICGSPAPIKSLVTEDFDSSDLTVKMPYKCVEELSPSAVNPSVGGVKCLEAYEGVVPPMVNVAERIGMNALGGVTLPMVGGAQLVRPPGYDFGCY